MSAKKLPVMMLPVGFWLHVKF